MTTKSLSHHTPTYTFVFLYIYTRSLTRTQCVCCLRGIGYDIVGHTGLGPRSQLELCLVWMGPLGKSKVPEAK